MVVVLRCRDNWGKSQPSVDLILNLLCVLVWKGLVLHKMVSTKIYLTMLINNLVIILPQIPIKKYQSKHIISWDGYSTNHRVWFGCQFCIDLLHPKMLNTKLSATYAKSIQSSDSGTDAWNVSTLTCARNVSSSDIKLRITSLHIRCMSIAQM